MAREALEFPSYPSPHAASQPGCQEGAGTQTSSRLGSSLITHPVSWRTVREKVEGNLIQRIAGLTGGQKGQATLHFLMSLWNIASSPSRRLHLRTPLPNWREERAAALLPKWRGGRVQLRRCSHLKMKAGFDPEEDYKWGHQRSWNLRFPNTWTKIWDGGMSVNVKSALQFS